MAVQNLLQSATTGRTQEQKPDYRNTCFEFNADETPFLTLLTGGAIDASSTPLNSSPVRTAGEFYWFEKEDVPRYTTLSSAAATAAVGGATTLTLSDATIFTYGDTLQVDTNTNGDVGELMWISEFVSSTTEVTVLRGAGGTTPDAIGSGSRVTRVGSAMNEADILRKGAIEGARTRLSGAVQEHRREIEMSERKMSADSWYDQTEFSLESAEALRQIKKDIEAMLWFNNDATVYTGGTPAFDTAPDAGNYNYVYRGGSVQGSTSNYLSAGVDGRISTNVYPGGGNMGYLDFCDMVGAVCKQNTGRVNELRLVAFCGSPVKGQISEWGYDSIRMDTAIGKRWGLDVTEVIVPRAPGPNKTIPFIYAPILDNTRMENGVYLLNFGGRNGGDIQYRYLQKSQGPNPMNFDIASMGADGKEISPIGGNQEVFMWKAIVGLEMRHEKSHAKITDFCNRQY